MMEWRQNSKHSSLQH